MNKQKWVNPFILMGLPQKIKILIVGAGGLGCQLIKNLIKIPHKIQIVIMDYDSISQTNLNRQFCFNKKSIKKYKTKILQQYFTGLKNAQIKIQTIEQNILSFNPIYFIQENYDVLISALDNSEARNYLTKMSLFCDIPMIDAGTSGFNGQVQTYARFSQQCRFCRQIGIQQTQNYAVCSIQNKPKRTVHCIYFSLNIFQQVLGYQVPSQKISAIMQKFTKQQAYLCAVTLHNYLFHQILPEIQGINKIYYNKCSVLQSFNIQELQDDALKSTWQQSKFSTIFVYLMTQQLKQSKHQFDKDNLSDILLIYCLTNLRILNFIKTDDSNLKTLNFLECRDKAGKIIPAIASTNSIAASLQIIKLLQILNKKQCRQNYSLIRCYDIQDKICCFEGYKPSIECQKCSPFTFYIILSANFSQITFGRVQQFLIEQIDSQFDDRDLKINNYTVIRNNGKIWHSNKNKLLNFNKNLIKKSMYNCQSVLLQYFRTQRYRKYYQILIKNSPQQHSQIKIIKLPQFQLQQSLISKQQPNIKDAINTNAQITHQIQVIEQCQL